MEQPKIYQAMANIVKSVESVSKDRKSQGNFSFAYRGIDDVMNALHSSFATHGVFMTQEILEHRYDAVDKRLHHLIKVKFTFHAVDGSSISSLVMGECIESGDKGVGKAMSYALKTCLLQTFLIPTADEAKDPDSQAPQVNYAPRKENENVNSRTVRQSSPTIAKAPVSKYASIEDHKEDVLGFIDLHGNHLMASTGKDAGYYKELIKGADTTDKLEAYTKRLKEIVDSIGKKS